MVALSPLESEFASTEEAETYELWLREKVTVAMADQSPAIPHHEVMAEMRKLIDDRRRAASHLAK